MDNNNSNTNQNFPTNASSGPFVSKGAQPEASTAPQDVSLNLVYSRTFYIENGAYLIPIYDRLPMKQGQLFRDSKTAYEHDRDSIKNLVVDDFFTCEFENTNKPNNTKKPNNIDKLNEALSWCVKHIDSSPANNLSYEEFLSGFNSVRAAGLSYKGPPLVFDPTTSYKLTNLTTLTLEKLVLDFYSFSKIGVLPLTSIDLIHCKLKDDHHFCLDFSKMKFLKRIYFMTSEDSKPIEVTPSHNASEEVVLIFSAISTLRMSRINCGLCKSLKKLQVNSPQAPTIEKADGVLTCYLPSFPLESFEWTVPPHLSGCISYGDWWSNMTEARLISDDFKFVRYDTSKDGCRAIPRGWQSLKDLVKPKSGTALSIWTPNEFNGGSFVQL